jgi:hypothetical protein
VVENVAGLAIAAGRPIATSVTVRVTGLGTRSAWARRLGQDRDPRPVQLGQTSGSSSDRVQAHDCRFSTFPP